MDADSQVCPSQGVRGKRGNLNLSTAKVAWEDCGIERELAGK